jgi:putative membrane protein insertion efficiency factor
MRAAGAPFRALEIGLIRAYRATLSGWLGGQCRFYPSCSHYAEDAIRSRGAVRGTLLAAWRVLRCNPFGSGGIDRVGPHPRDALYDAITPPPLRGRAGA